MSIFHVLKAALLLALLHGVGAKTGFKTGSRIDEELLLEESVFWGREIRNLKGMSMHLAPKLNVSEFIIHSVHCKIHTDSNKLHARRSE
jgi:hypothetical protein